MSGQLVVESLSKHFSGVQALSEISLSINSDEITGLIGPNGSGKTTLFNVITGVHPPDEGSITWDSKDITGIRMERLARLGVVRTFQERMIFPDLTVYENVEVAAVSAGLRGNDRTKSIMRALEMLGVDEVAGELASDMPFGTTRRVAVACTLPFEPRLVLLDEPAAGLSAYEADELADALEWMADEGIGVCVIDHNMEFIRPLCSNIIVMDHGSVLAQGGVEIITENEEVGRAYFGGETGD